MEGDVRRSRKPIVAAGGLGLIATFIVGTIVAGWLTEADVGWSLGYVLVRWTRQQPRQRRVPVHGPRLARNGGLSWALLGRTSLARGAIRRLHVDPADANVLLVALSRSNFGRDSNNDPPPPPSHGVYRSTNGGVTWSRIDGPWWSDPFDNIGRSNGRIELAIASSDPDVVYAGIVESIGSPRKGSLLGLFRTDDAWWRTDNFFNSTMPSWRANRPDRPFPTAGFDSFTDPGTIQSITFVAEDRRCETYAYGTRGGEVRLTRDGGTTWADLDPAKTLSARPINSIAVDPTNSNSAFVAVSSYDVATPTGQDTSFGLRTQCHRLRLGRASVRPISHLLTCRSTSSPSIRVTHKLFMPGATTVCGRVRMAARRSPRSGARPVFRQPLFTTFRSTRRRTGRCSSRTAAALSI
jgi:hypothetical protein